MSFLQILINAVIPTIAIMFTGYFAERHKMISENGAVAINDFVLYFAFPALIFHVTAKSDIHEILQLRFISGFVFAMVFSYVTAGFIAHFFIKKNTLLTSFRALASSFPNAGFMGLPILQIIFGKAGLLPGVITCIITLLAVIIAVYSIESSIHAEMSLTRRLTKVLKQLLKNPLLSPALAGIIYSSLGLPLPESMDNYCYILGQAAGPAALFAVGQSLYGKKTQVEIPGMILILSTKLIFQPALTFILLWWLGVDPLWIATGVIIAALPTGSVLYMLAAKYKAYVLQSAKVILYTTLGSVFTICFYLWLIEYIWPFLIKCSTPGCG